MPFLMDDEQRARWAAIEDDLFPDWMGIWADPEDGDDATPLAELPLSGNGLWILCTRCWVQRWVGGWEICHRWPTWLGQAGVRWARALRCDACDGRRFALMCEPDPEATGFRASTMEDELTIAARRMAAWLEGGPVTIGDLAPHLPELRSRDSVGSAGL